MHLFYLYNYSLFFCLTINLSKQAKTAGNKVKIKIVEHRVPCETVLHIFEAIADVKFAIIKVTIINIELDVKIV